MSQRIGIMRLARLCRSTMYSLACGLIGIGLEAKGLALCTEAVCSDVLWIDNTNMQLCSFWGNDLGL